MTTHYLTIISCQQPSEDSSGGVTRRKTITPENSNNQNNRHGPSWVRWRASCREAVGESFVSFCREPLYWSERTQIGLDYWSERTQIGLDYWSERTQIGLDYWSERTQIGLDYLAQSRTLRRERNSFEVQRHRDFFFFNFLISFRIAWEQQVDCLTVNYSRRRGHVGRDTQTVPDVLTVPTNDGCCRNCCKWGVTSVARPWNDSDPCPAVGSLRGGGESTKKVTTILRFTVTSFDKSYVQVNNSYIAEKKRDRVYLSVSFSHMEC